MRELWADIPGLPGYSASTLGRIRGKSGRILGCHMVPRGYYVFNAYKPGKVIAYTLVHRAVLLAFVGDPPSEKHEARHLNGVTSDNRLDNLAWGTHQENMDDMKRHGTQVGHSGSSNPNSTFTEADVLEMRRLYYGEGWTLPQLAEKFGVRSTTIGNIVRYKTWVHI